MQDQELLHKIDVRLARVEERLKDLHDIKTSIDNLKWRVAGISGGISLIIGAASLFSVKLLEIISWVLGELGTAAQRHKERALKFIRDASLRAEKRRQERKK